MLKPTGTTDMLVLSDLVLLITGRRGAAVAECGGRRHRRPRRVFGFDPRSDALRLTRRGLAAQKEMAGESQRTSPNSSNSPELF